MPVQVTLLEERGADLALRGMSYSFKDRAEDPGTWWTAKRQRAYKRSVLLAPKDLGHNKFLRQIMVWVDIEAPRCWWSEFDTYKVGTVTQSESTMHTLSKRPPTPSDFEAGTPARMIIAFTAEWGDYQNHKDITRLKLSLPEGFLQRRLVTMNYQTIREIVRQRDGHRLKFWKQFIDQLVPQLAHPEYIYGAANEEAAAPAHHSV